MKRFEFLDITTADVAFAAYGQSDFKRLVAYSSVNHMGFVVLGIAAAAFAANTWIVLKFARSIVSTRVRTHW